jgi:CPA2 family monovalent cation:H+ antiporter-2
VFFVFFGLSTSPGSLPPVLLPALALAVITSVTKLATGYIAAQRVKVKRRGRWRAAVALIPRGEFSVVMAALAVAAGAEADIGPLTACYVLLTIIIGAAVQRLPDRLKPEPRRRRAPQEPTVAS